MAAIEEWLDSEVVYELLPLSTLNLASKLFACVDYYYMQYHAWSVSQSIRYVLNNYYYVAMLDRPVSEYDDIYSTAICNYYPFVHLGYFNWDNA